MTLIFHSDKAKSLFSCGTRMEKALQRLADAKMALNPGSPRKNEDNSTQTEDGMRKVNITVVDTPPATPTTQNSYLSMAFKGLPKALLEKVDASVGYFLFYFRLFLNNLSCVRFELSKLRKPSKR